MPVFYFHVRNGENFEEDPEGIDLPTIEKAEEEAILGAREILAERLRSGEVVDGQSFVITSEDGRVLREVPFKSVLKFD
ncbi:DUF6894 family protein [Rhizobium sp. 1399]|jgi:hypothetical protein|uniref:DUF6894 family protein n=1 Tax=unclassified Rhizobium TaxID=2613769 RepID=UPI002859C334|nr:hypothetical protein [Rhizobium sp. 1399]MDR6667816.1 hypothetical protein [Rhizobium sp. 1399]